MTMVLANREIKRFEEIEEILNSQKVCNVAMVDGDEPYVLPFNYFYEEKIVYLHCAPEGKKMDVLKKNNKVCISVYEDGEVFYRHEHVACSYGWRYRSVVLHGKAEFVEDYHEKIVLLNRFMKKYTGKDDFKYNEPAVKNVKIIKVEIERITGKKYGR